MLVGVYLALNVVVVVDGLYHVVAAPARRRATGATALTTEHGSPLAMIGVALLVFPKLALGLSGFETGVAVMPLVKGDARATPSETRPAASAAPQKLLTTAALIMSVLPDHHQPRHHRC